VALDEPARNAAERCGWTTIMADALVEASEGDYWAAVDRVSQNWFRPDDHDLTVFNDVSLGNLLFFEFGDSILYSLIRRAYLAQAIVERFAPTHIVVAGASSPEIARVMAAAAPRATVRTVALRSARPLRDMLDPRLLRLTLRRAGVDRVLRALVFRLGNMIRAFPSAPLKTDRGKVFAVVDIPTGSIMDTLAPVVRRLGAERAIVLTTDPRAVSAMRSRGLSTRIFDPGTYRWSGHENRAAHRFVQDCWRTLDARLSRGADAVRCRGLDLWPLMRDASRRLVLRRLPWALRELAAARALLTDVRPSLILTASDAHYAAQIFTVVGRGWAFRRYPFSMAHSASRSVISRFAPPRWRCGDRRSRHGASRTVLQAIASPSPGNRDSTRCSHARARWIATGSSQGYNSPQRSPRFSSLRNRSPAAPSSPGG